MPSRLSQLKSERAALLTQQTQKRRLLQEYKTEEALAGPEARARLRVKMDMLDEEITVLGRKIDKIDEEIESQSLENQEDRGEQSTKSGTGRRWLWLAGGLTTAAILLFAILQLVDIGPDQPAPPIPLPATDTPAITPTIPVVEETPTSEIIPSPTSEPTPSPEPEPPPEVERPPSFLVPSPLPVHLSMDNCDEQGERLIEQLEAGGGKVVSADQALMTINARCQDDQIDLNITLPDKPAQRIEFLDEPQTLALTAEAPYGRTFLLAAIAYAVGEYDLAVKESGDLSPLLDNSTVQFLHAQSLMHAQQWSDAIDAYSAIIKSPEPDDALLANAYGGRGLAYVLRTTELFFSDEDDHEDCTKYAAADFETANEMQPQRAFWLVGLAKARFMCSVAEEDENIIPILESALGLASKDAHPSGAIAEALALTMLAEQVYIYAEEVPNPVWATDYAESAIEIAPELPTAYEVLGNISRTADDEKTGGLFQKYFERIILDGQRTKALQRYAAFITDN